MITPICNSIFLFDELNENTLKIKYKSLVDLGQHTLACNAFDKYIIKYRDINGEDY